SGPRVRPVGSAGGRETKRGFPVSTFHVNQGAAAEWAHCCRDADRVLRLNAPIMTSDSFMNHSSPPPRAPADSIGRLAELIAGDPQARLDADMAHVLDRLAGLGARPQEVLTPI